MQPSTPSRDEWRQQLAHSQPELDQLSNQLASSVSRSSDIRIMRSSQADAARLDDELTLLLREQFMKIFSLFNPATISRFQPELTLLLEFLIFKYSVWDNKPLPGMALMNLRFRNERVMQRNNEGHSGVEGPGLTATQRSLYCLGSVFLRYFWTRAGQSVTSAHWGDSPAGSWRAHTWQMMRGAETAYRIGTFFNLLDFLRTGRYRSVLERLLGARLVYAQPSAGRAISYEYLNRQLVWAEVSEVVLFLLPLVNVAAVKRAMRSILPNLPEFPFSEGEGQATVAQGVAASPCGICGAEEVNLPYQAEPCGHIFCYYCLCGSTQADPKYECPLCLTKIERMKPAYRRCHEESFSDKSR